MATIASPTLSTVVPAQLGFLAIFNPSLGTSDETIDDQIVYYSSLNSQSQKPRRRTRGKPTDHISQDERNERLRQIGLAQGMVDFGRGFAEGSPVETVETEKSRIVLRELEPGWWILASIDLSKIPLPPRLGSSPNKNDEPSENVEYSSRELKPAALLQQDLLRAHSIFLLHHATSLSALFVKSRRSKFVSLLSRYWDLYLSTWDVMLHGNPACNIFGGIKMAACGELGMGVGEEDRGSGEREVLEGFVDRVEGLLDLVVSKYGPADPIPELNTLRNDTLNNELPPKWLGTGLEPGAEDGAVFLGIGALSKKSLRDIMFWMEDLYTWGEDAYGVSENVSSMRQRRRPRRTTIDTKDGSHHTRKHSTVGEQAPPKQANGAEATAPTGVDVRVTKPTDDAANESGVDKLKNYLKMGYGTHWSLGSSGSAKDSAQSEVSTSGNRPQRPPPQPRQSSTASGASGHYLIGLVGDIDESGGSDPDGDEDQEDDTVDENYDGSRVMLRTLTVELDSDVLPDAEKVQDLGSHDTELMTTKSGRKDYMDPNSSFDSQDRNKSKKVRVVVYVSKPFIYTFIFRNRTDSLAWDGLYRSLHHQLSPLRKPLAASTSYRPGKPDIAPANSNIFDLVWDPKSMTIHSTIPNIPNLRPVPEDSTPSLWSRAEALNTHNQVLNTYIASLADYTELERTCKTSRGWWVVWTRIMDKDVLPSPSVCTEDVDAPTPPGESPKKLIIPSMRPGESIDSATSSAAPATSAKPKPRVNKEIFLVRRAGEHSAARARSDSADGVTRLAHGIGVDTHKYIEGLLSLGR
ncbi:hypothetical protein F4780DRAFT_455299 [Xylariomycetidae sp. FL0641]|nr:hypothetical protein F4780DRAFT_455299 [Xylariomycetidae sp. FL0641]